MFIFLLTQMTKVQRTKSVSSEVSQRHQFERIAEPFLGHLIILFSEALSRFSVFHKWGHSVQPIHPQKLWEEVVPKHSGFHM